MGQVTKLFKSSTTSSDAENGALKLKVLHETDSRFRNVVKYKIYRLLDMSQTYNGNVPARTCKYAKRMGTLMKAHKFEDKDPITILVFLAQFEKACSLHGVSERMALWIMPNFTKDEPAYRLPVRMILPSGNRTTCKLPKTGKE